VEELCKPLHEKNEININKKERNEQSSINLALSLLLLYYLSL